MSLFLSPVQERVKSTPDPDAFEKCRDTPPVSIAVLLQNYALLLAVAAVHTPPMCITIRLPFLSRYFCRSIKVRGRWNTPQSKSRGEKWGQHSEKQPIFLLHLGGISSTIQQIWCAGTTPILETTLRECRGNENLSGGVAAIPGIAPRVAPRIVGFVLIKS